MLKEFKTFVMRGNVLDLAVAVIIGGVFGKIVSSLVNDVLMPPIGLVVGKVDFSSLYLNLSVEHLRVARRGPEGGRSRHQVRPVHQHGDRLPHRVLRHLPCRTPGEPSSAPAGRRSTRGAHDQGMSLLSFHHPAQGHPLRPLHVGDQIEIELARSPCRGLGSQALIL